MTVGEKIKYLRERKNLSQNELAFTIGLSQSTLHYIENDSAKIRNNDTLKKIADALDVNIEYLKENSGNITAPERISKENKIIAKVLKKLRIKNNLKATELSDILNIPQSTISGYETGQRNLRSRNKIGKTNLEKYCNLFPELGYIIERIDSCNNIDELLEIDRSVDDDTIFISKENNDEVALDSTIYNIDSDIIPGVESSLYVIDSIIREDDEYMEEKQILQLTVFEKIFNDIEEFIQFKHSYSCEELEKIKRQLSIRIEVYKDLFKDDSNILNIKLSRIDSLI